MNDHAWSAKPGSIPAPGLLILTGASHTGKTTLANAVLAVAPRPAAYLSVDDVLHRILRRPSGEVWSNIPLAYELLIAELGLLLDDGWFVIVESTFTYVGPGGKGEFHSEALGRLLDEARSRKAPRFLVQLAAPKEVVLGRATQTGRLDPSIVSTTIALHELARFPLSPRVIHTDRFDAAESSGEILNWLGAEASSPEN